MEARDQACGVRGRASGGRYRFAAGDGVPRVRCLRHAILFPPVFRRAVRVAVLVGTALFLINQADVVLGGDLTPGVAAKIGLTYLIPFSVATYSALAINRLRDGDTVGSFSRTLPSRGSGKASARTAPTLHDATPRSNDDPG